MNLHFYNTLFYSRVSMFFSLMRSFDNTSFSAQTLRKKRLYILSIYGIFTVFTTSDDVFFSLHMRHMPEAKPAFHPPKTMHYWWLDQRETLKHTLCFPVWRGAAQCVWTCAHERAPATKQKLAGFLQWLAESVRGPIKRQMMTAEQPLAQAHSCHHDNKTSVTNCHHQCLQSVLLFSPSSSFFLSYTSQHFTCVMPSFQELADAIFVFTLNPGACIDKSFFKKFLYNIQRYNFHPFLYL